LEVRQCRDLGQCFGEIILTEIAHTGAGHPSDFVGASRLGHCDEANGIDVATRRQGGLCDAPTNRLDVAVDGLHGATANGVAV